MLKEIQKGANARRARMVCHERTCDAPKAVAGESNGAEDWNRTSDTSIFSAVLYQLSYLGRPQSITVPSGDRQPAQHF
jgi:hypothetical protein